MLSFRVEQSEIEESTHKIGAKILRLALLAQDDSFFMCIKFG